jgi:hypothetical protein
MISWGIKSFSSKKFLLGQEERTVNLKAPGKGLKAKSGNG